MPRILVPPVWFLLAGCVMIVLHHSAPGMRLVPQALGWLGFVPVAIGVTLALSGARLFRRAGTAIEPWGTPSALVVEGPYRFSRNPMYLGLALSLLGLAVWLGTLTPFLVIPLFVWLITVLFIRPEEQRLEDRFGSRYLAYKARVHRWV
jgi:protein-S-isoprenylcysteine O-methyltransferase Ste14